MNIARRRWSPDEKAAIKRMFEEGYTYTQIAEKLRPGVKTAWRSVGEIVREEIKPQPLAPQMPGQPAAPLSNPVSRQLSSPSSVDLPESLEDSLTAREMMSMLDDEQREVFVATYEDMMGNADEEQVTRAEKEMFLKGSFAHVKYLRANRMVALCEHYLMMDLDGYLGDTDQDKAKKRLAGSGEKYKKDADTHHNEYMEVMKSLKLTREQRLDKIKDTRNTLLDLQAELSRKAKQESIVDDIKKINMATKEEFLRMSRGEVGPDGQVHPWLIGAFEEALPPISAPQPAPPKENSNDGTQKNQ